MKKSLLFARAGSEVMRYHTLTTLVKETVGHHSHMVAMISHILDSQCSREVLLAALTHDLAEQATGDIPSTSKRLYGVGDQVTALENTVMTAAGLQFPNLTDYEKRLLKLADIAQGALFCAREISLGNRRMRAAFDNYMSYATGMDLVGIEEELFEIIRGEAL